MPLSILTNISSLRVQRKLSESTDQLQRTYERLSSGQRINHPSDDAAGLAVASLLHHDARLITTALRNTNDGLSLLAIEDGALGAITNVLTRMSELAQQSANGIYTTAQRSPLQTEFDELANEIERIAKTTHFNGRNLLSIGANVVLQVGIDGSANSQITLRGIKGTLESVSLAGAGSSSLSYSINGVTEIEAQAAARTALEAVYVAMGQISERRGEVGADESRLSHSISNLSQTRSALETSESAIRSVDVAEEVSKMLRLQILQQAGAAVLAQANQQPTVVLELLGGSSKTNHF